MTTERPIEVKKHAYRQTQDGIVISFVVHPNDVSPALAAAPLGTRYGCALVEIRDDETPVSPEQQSARAKPEKDRKRWIGKKWHELPPSQQAAIRCNEGKFWEFLGQQKIGAKVFGDSEAAAAVRRLCDVASRKNLDTDGFAAGLWRSLDSDYRFWLQHQEAGQ